MEHAIEALGLVDASFVIVDRMMNGSLPVITTFTQREFEENKEIARPEIF